MKWATNFMAVLIVFAFASVAVGHDVYIEDQALWPWPGAAPAEYDFSFETPFELDDAVNSKAVFGFLTWGDYDVFALETYPEDFIDGDGYPEPVMIAASGLSPACWQSKRNYVSTALVGPLGPTIAPVNPEWDLPFEVPPGYGVVLKENPEFSKCERRPIFSEESSGNSWFLPKGLTEECLFDFTIACDFSNTIFQPVMVPGTYYVVMWDVDGYPQDYTANIGFLESEYQERPEEELVQDGKHLHMPFFGCIEPYLYF